MSELEAEYKAITVGMTLAQKKIWTNNLIWDEITSYLRISDLKAMSLVNKSFLEKIRKSRRLVFKQTLKTHLEVYVPVLGRAVVEVNRVSEIDLDNFGSDVFETVTHLELRRLGKIPSKIRNHLLKRIICFCKMLKSMDFGAQNFFMKDFQDLFRDEGVKQILSQLDELHIGVENINYQEYDFEEDDSQCDIDTDPLESFKLFPNLSLKLKKFTFRETYYRIIPTQFYPELILRSSLNFLVDIDLQLDISGAERLKSLHIPKLAKLNLSFFGTKIRDAKIPDYNQVFIDNLIPFIKRHVENLKTLGLSGGEYSLAPICDILKKSKKIRSLGLKSDRHFMPPSVNWDFLQTLSTLRTFELWMFQHKAENENNLFRLVELMKRPGPRDSWLSYLMALPSTVTSINMFGFEKEETPQLLQVTGALGRFQNLTELSMLFCFEFLLDDTLQFICSHLTKLRILQCDFSKITDYGISGCREDGSDSGISLKNLKGLNELKMSFCYPNCPNSPMEITWTGLLSSIQFLELFQLSIGGSLKDLHGDSERSDSKDGYNYLKLIQQNPSLESCHLRFYRPGNWFGEEACKLNPRLKLY